VIASRVLRMIAFVVVAASAMSCSNALAKPSAAPTPLIPSSSLGAGHDPVIAAAGDIACDPTLNIGAPAQCDQGATAAQIIALGPDAVISLGDNQYEANTATAYASVFDETWGQFKSLIHPTIGNHEYLTSGATGYFGYFGAAAGDPTKGYYSWNLGSWHIIALNSECSHVGGCDSGSAQETWLRADLAAHPNACTLVSWHEPRWSSGEHGDAIQMAAIWDDLAVDHVDVVLAGHNHDYERLPPLDGSGAPAATGVQEFVVGTGGKNHYRFAAPPIAGEVRDDTSFGILKLTLHPTSYEWQFLPAPGYVFSDAGSMDCR
jgi:hypothetical protein